VCPVSYCSCRIECRNRRPMATWGTERIFALQLLILNKPLECTEQWKIYLASKRRQKELQRFSRHLLTHLKHGHQNKESLNDSDTRRLVGWHWLNMYHSQYMMLLPISSGRYVMVTMGFTSWFYIAREKTNDKWNEKRKFAINEINAVKALK
jgi:hypothetical protein